MKTESPISTRRTQTATVWSTSSTVEERLGRPVPRVTKDCQDPKVLRARKVRKGRMVPRAIKGPRDPRDPKVIQDRKDQKDRKGSLAIPGNRATATAPSCATEGVR